LPILDLAHQPGARKAFTVAVGGLPSTSCLPIVNPQSTIGNRQSTIANHPAEDSMNFWRWQSRKRTREAELDRELQSHIDVEVDEQQEAGLPPEEAMYAARRALGNATQIKEDVRMAWGLHWLEILLQDFSYGLRVLSRNRCFAATAIVILALGIGATTAIFSVVDTVTLKPLPFPNAGRLVRIRSLIAATRTGSGIASYPDFLDWRARNHVFVGMAAFRTDDLTLLGSAEPLHLQGAVVSAQLFSLVGVRPALGRGFRPDEDHPAATNGADPVIFSYDLWRREFDSDASVLGRTIQLGGELFTVVGVMPKGFKFPVQAGPVDLWTTMAVDARGGAKAMTAQRGAHYLDVVGLLKAQVSLRQAQAEMATIASSLSKQHPESKPRTVQLVPEIEGVVGPLRAPLFVLLGAVCCVLMIVCANVANLLLARATGRDKEMAVRAALGASRRRATCQVLTESIALGLLGGGLGLALALALLGSLVRLMPVEVPRLSTIGLNFRLLGFSFGVSVLAGVLFGLAPALRVSKINLTESLKESGRGRGSAGGERGRLRDALVAAEFAIAVVLVAAAGLLLQSFLHLFRTDPGFNPHHVLTFELDSPAGKQLPEFYHDVMARMGALPGVRATSAVASLPLTGDNIGATFEIEGQPAPAGSRPSTEFNAVEPDYFHTLGIALLEGRDFTPHDNLESAPVAIVSRRFARRFFPSQDPIGKHIRPGIANGYSGGPPMREIVGVAGDVKQAGLGDAAAPQVYAPVAQCPFNPMFIVIRTETDPLSIAAPARRGVAAVDKNAPIYHVETLDQYFADSLAAPRFITLLISGFAGLALLLACVGIYGVVSYIAAQSTHEIGIRMALGAQRRDVLLMVTGHGLRLALVGIGIGVLGASGLTRFLSSLLYGVKATDAITFATVSLILTAVALLACYIPARRAAKVDPMVALRRE
jgi:putative ABC transport system permease protein